MHMTVKLILIQNKISKKSLKYRIISPICENFVLANISQRQLLIKIVHTVFGMTNASDDLEFRPFNIQVPIKFWSLKLSFIQVLPIYTLEPWIIFQRHKSWSSQSTLRLIFIKQLFHEFTCLFVLESSRVFQLKVQYLFVNLQRIFTFLSERHVTTHELKHIDAQRVKTDCKGVTLSNNDFWSHIMRSTNKGKCFSRHDVSALNDLSSHKVDQFKVALHINHKVFRLEISHDDSLSGEIFQNEDHGCHIKLSILCAQQPYFSDSIVEFFSLHKLHQRVQIMLIFKAFVIFHDKGMIQTSQQIFLLRNVLEKRMFFNFLLAVALQDIELLLFKLVQTANQQNRSKLSLFQLLQHHQLVQTINQLIPLLDLLMKFFSLPLLILLHHCIHEPTNDFFHNISFDLSYNPVRLHHNIVLISRLRFVLKQKLLSINLRSNSNRIDIFILFKGSLNNNDNLLIVHILSVFFNHHVSGLITINLHQIQYLFNLLLRQLRQMSTLLNCPFHEISESNHKNLISKNFTKSLSPQNQASHVLFSLYSHLPDCVIEKGLLSKGISLLKLSHQFVAFVDGSRAFFYDIKG